MFTPTIGRIVHYTLSESDVALIKDLRERMAGIVPTVGNVVEPGQVYPAMIVRTWSDAPIAYVNLQVFLDGNHVYWATSRQAGVGDGHWEWPQRTIG